MKFTKLVEISVEAKRRVKEEAMKAMNAPFQAFFSSHPDVKAIEWTQYTPGFNDGDPCQFGVRDLVFTVALPNSDDECDKCSSALTPSSKFCSQCGHSLALQQREEISTTAWDLKYLKDKEKLVLSDDLITEAQELSSEIGGLQDSLEVVFGDHKKIVVTRKGIDVINYQDHD